MSNTVMQVLVFLAACVVVARAEPALNRMGPKTKFTIRLSFHSLAVGSIAEIIWILSGDIPNWPAAVIMVGAACLLLCERRIRLLYPPIRRTQ